MESSYLLRQLAQLCADHPLIDKTLFVPGVRAGYDLTTALARAGTSWTNLRVTTPILHASQVLAPRRAAAGARRPDAFRRELLVEGLLAAWPESSRRYFRGAVAGRGLAASLAATLDALRLAGIAPQDLSRGDGGGPSDAEKAADLSFLQRAYEERLGAEGWWDDAEVLQRAMAAATPASATVWAILDETDLPPLAENYVRAVAGADLWRLGRRVYGTPPPPHSAAARFPAAPIPAAPAANDRTVDSPPPLPRPASRTGAQRPTPGSGLASGATLAQGDLFLDRLRDADPSATPGTLYAVDGTSKVTEDGIDVAPGGRLLTTGLSAADAARLRLVQAVGLETEVRAVLRDILARGLAFDEVEVAFTASTPYESLLYDAVQRWELAADFVAGVPTRLTRPGRSLAAFLSWVATGLDGLQLADHLYAGDLGWQNDDVHPAQVAAWLRQGRAGTGSDLLAALHRLELAPPPRRDGEEAAAAEARAQHRRAAAQHHLRELLAAAEGEDLAGLAAGAARVIQAQPWPAADDGTAAADRRTRERLVSDLEDLAAAPSPAGSIARHAERLLAWLETHRVQATRARPGHLRLVPLRDAGTAGRPHLYVLGLDESRFPGMPMEDPVLLDVERARLSPGLRRERTRPAEATFHLVRALGTATGTATLLASRLHLADGREPWPAPLFEQARRQLGSEPTWARPLPDGVGVDELEEVLAARDTEDFADRVTALYPATARGARAQRARTQRAPTRFDGWIQAEDAERIDLDGTRVLSSQMLESLAACPRRYLWRYGLGLRPPQVSPRDPRRWLQPLEMGNLLHGLFLDFMARLQARGERPAADQETELLAMVDSAIDAERTRVPVTLEAAFRSDRRRIERAARVFLLAEAQRFAADPSLCAEAFERDFGMDGDGEVRVRLGDTLAFRLRGRVDRIDRVTGAEAAWEIWDYKTGSTWGYEANDLLRGGRHLQWALYAHALPALVDDAAPVRTSGYFFASERGAGQRVAAAPPPAAELGDLLAPLFELARGGFFPAVQRGEDRPGGACRFCDFRRVCADEALVAGDAEDLLAAAAELAGLVEGWVDLVAGQGRRASRAALESAFDERGLAPGDVVPEDLVHVAGAWVAP